MWKSNCVSCNKKIPNPENNYQIRGNWCIKCCGKIESIIKYCHSKGYKKEKKYKEIKKLWGMSKNELDDRCKIGYC